jgi:hypothetical protein
MIFSPRGHLIISCSIVGFGWSVGYSSKHLEGYSNLNILWPSDYYWGFARAWGLGVRGAISPLKINFPKIP